MKNTPLLNTLDQQTSPLGRPYRQIQVRRNLQMPQKWVGRELKSCWIYTFRYTDEQGGMFEVHEDYYGITKIVKKSLVEP